jgi:hypothetical protein
VLNSFYIVQTHSDMYIIRSRTSYYKEKYLVESNMQQMLYNLAILDFNEHDVNVLYTCHYGFEQYRKNLTLDNGNFKSTYLFELFLFILGFNKIFFFIIGSSTEGQNVVQISTTPLRNASLC